jgi:hypothetical protein
MDNSVSFPLFVFEKNDYSMFVLDMPDQILSHIEPQDIENGRYLYWDADGRAVRISMTGKGVAEVFHGETEIPLAEAMRRHSEVYGLDVDMTGPLDQVRVHLKQAETRQPHGRGLWLKLFRRSRT